VSIEQAKKLLEADGYVVLRAKSYRQAEERRRIAENRAYWEERAAEHARIWARECREYERRVGERCTYLYGLAARHGATDEELRGE
jgi:hypothetical protein